MAVGAADKAPAEAMAVGAADKAPAEATVAGAVDKVPAQATVAGAVDKVLDKDKVVAARTAMVTGQVEAAREAPAAALEDREVPVDRLWAEAWLAVWVVQEASEALATRTRKRSLGQRQPLMLSTSTCPKAAAVESDRFLN
jgi:hypothetical protein